MSFFQEIPEDDEFKALPTDAQDSIREINASTRTRLAYWATYDRTVNGVHYDTQGRMMCDSPASYFFGLSYASWLAIPRLTLQEMPIDWQVRFFALLEEADDMLSIPEDIEVVQRRGGRFKALGAWNNYRRGTVAQALEQDKAKEA